MIIKNTYFTSYFPLISIIFFSMSFAINVQIRVVDFLRDFGIYEGMLEFFTDGGIKLTIFFLLVLIFFMVIAALKLIADTMVQLSLLFFSKDAEGYTLNKIRVGSWIYLLASVVAMVTFKVIIVPLALFLLASLIYFIFFIYRVSDHLSVVNQIGLVCFHLFFWSGFLFTVAFAVLKLYNSFVKSLPII
ncbi:DUF5366 family protein [Calidifontibacillus oryziterrae]|uniref:DUF5366 family protein n=1 Tax=Calidifontibacillus oryziterrae TaxID=1191699 RepID=UPI0002F49C56|nr:DUF5366 family protein [Calidifontibacillus oryziterrae]